MQNYKVIIPKQTQERARNYWNRIKGDLNDAGKYVYNSLKNKNLENYSVEDFLEILFQTKEPQIFAESSIHGNGKDWNLTELGILGDISVAVPVTIFDNGQHRKPLVYATPFEGVLLYTPGALLRNDVGNEPADWSAVTVANSLDYGKYYALYERRLLPLLIHANTEALEAAKKAFITIPGLGCGMFAGRFQGELGLLLKRVLVDLLEKHGDQFSNIQAVYYDPYQECANERLEIQGISLMVRPLTKGNQGKSQLAQLTIFEEASDDFSDCLLFSVVAWDHVSWPGNDFYIDSRATDDGVKAAATSSMYAMTGVEGTYNKKTYSYEPPAPYRNWDEVIVKKQLNLHLKENLLVL
jgi:hypothetical protein